jgi:serine/threonine-protein kinase
MVHRDIKPANLMSAQRGARYDVTKLLDFGLVKTLTHDQSVHLSQEGAVAGSPLYMAPEQVMNTSPPDARTDIYGLGAVAYFMLTGRPPFTGKNAMAVMIAHSRDPVTPLRQLRPEIPADLEEVVLRCLAKDPRERYPDASALAEALAACAEAANWSPEHAAQWWRRHCQGELPVVDSSEGHGPSSADLIPSESHDSPVSTRVLQATEPPRYL